MKAIVGLGNPGKKYQTTRHNVGFRVVEEILNQKSKIKKQKYKLKFKNKDKFKAEIYWLDKEALLVKPQTFMNESGKAVEMILRYYDIRILGDLWVIHDDLDLELGRIKIQKGGGTAGHHGIESIIKEIGSPDFVRFRLGIGGSTGSKPVDNGIVDYVLDSFKRGEQDIIDSSIKKMTQAVLFALEEGIEKAMNEFNK